MINTVLLLCTIGFSQEDDIDVQISNFVIAADRNDAFEIRRLGVALASNSDLVSTRLVSRIEGGKDDVNVPAFSVLANFLPGIDKHRVFVAIGHRLENARKVSNAFTFALWNLVDLDPSMESMLLDGNDEERLRQSLMPTFIPNTLIHKRVENGERHHFLRSEVLRLNVANKISYALSSGVRNGEFNSPLEITPIELAEFSDEDRQRLLKIVALLKEKRDSNDAQLGER